MKYSWLLLLTCLLAACSSTSAPVTPATTVGSRPGGTGYPAPANQAYPLAKATAYPPPHPTPCQGPAFSITAPLKAGGTTVSGHGAANAQIEVVDITQKAAVLGTTTIAGDGNFTAKLSGGLPVEDQIGLMGSGSDRQRFLCGPGYQDLPTVGIILARARVAP